MISKQQFKGILEHVECNIGTKYQDFQIILENFYVEFGHLKPELFKRIADRFIDEGNDCLPTVNDFRFPVNEALKLQGTVQNTIPIIDGDGGEPTADDFKNIFAKLAEYREDFKRNHPELQALNIGVKKDPEIMEALHRRKQPDFKYKEHIFSEQEIDFVPDESEF